MIVQVLIAERDADDALHHHDFELVLNQFSGGRVGEAGGEALGQADRPIGLAQQQGAGVRADRAAIEAAHQAAAFDGWQVKQRGITVCRQWGILRIREKPWSQHNSFRVRATMHLIR